MGERTSNEMGSLSIQSKNRSPRDLLQRFMAGAAGAGTPGRSEPEDDRGSGSGEEVELNLGLSLGGRFGVNRSDSTLVRSSSIAAILPVVRDNDVFAGGRRTTGPGGPHRGIVRTSSLPVEPTSEWKKKKELRSLRRLAAKRRRSEKRVSGGSTDARLGCGGGGVPVAAGVTLPSSPATLQSQGSLSEFESRHLQGSSGSGGEASSLQEQTNHDVAGSSRSNRNVEPEPTKPAKSKGKEVRSCLEEMPCVFTRGDGPNGRRIDGILYKYGKGEQVKIMCVCHGSFLSPAEFVMHAGGTDVVHPLRHIVIGSRSLFS